MRSALAGCVLMLATASSSANGMANDDNPAAVAVVRRVCETVYEPASWALRKDVTYDQVVAVLKPALELWRKTEDAYTMVRCDHIPGQDSVGLYSLIRRTSGYASTLSPTDEGRERWWRTGWEIQLRMLRDATTQRRYREHLEVGRDTREAQSVAALLYRNTTAQRAGMCRMGIVGPDEWAALVGATWHDGRGDVVWKDDTAYVNVSILGPDIAVARGAQCVALRIGKRELRMAFGIRGRLQKSSASAMPGGKVYVPAEELQRRGLCEAAVYKDLQLVVIRPYAVPVKDKAR